METQTICHPWALKQYENAARETAKEKRGMSWYVIRMSGGVGGGESRGYPVSRLGFKPVCCIEKE